MNIVNNLSNNPNQSFSLTVYDGSIVTVNLSYWANQQGWYYNFSHPLLSQGWRRLVNSPNLLRQFRNVINFGLYCYVSDGYEPIYINDFTSGRVVLYLLNAQATQPSGTVVNEIQLVETNVIK